MDKVVRPFISPWFSLATLDTRSLSWRLTCIFATTILLPDLIVTLWNHKKQCVTTTEHAIYFTHLCFSKYNRQIFRHLASYHI